MNKSIAAWFLLLLLASAVVALHVIDLPKYNVPVYSLCTVDTEGNTNMNVITYAAAVGIRPTSTWTISLYKTTKSYQNFMANGFALLQLLDEEHHAGIVPILGKQSGKDINKITKLHEIKTPMTQVATKIFNRNDLKTDHITVLTNSINIIALQRKENIEAVNAGDHDVFFCNVINSYITDASKNNPNRQPLTSQYLRDKNII